LQEAGDLLLNSVWVKEIVLANQFRELTACLRGSSGPVRGRRGAWLLSNHPYAGIIEGLEELEAGVGAATLREDDLEVRITLLEEGIDKGW